MKTCPRCKIDKPLTDFYKNKQNKDGRGAYCKTCTIKNTLSWRKENKERADKHAVKNRRKALTKSYGITVEAYNELLQQQGNGCAICRRPATLFPYSLHIDHNHDTGNIRGLLCYKCNVYLGYIKDSTETLTRAIAHLQGINSSRRI